MNQMNDERRRALDALEEYVMNWKVFIDTSSLLDPAAELFWMNVIPLLKKHGKKAAVSYGCMQELEKYQSSSQNEELAEKVKTAAERLNQLRADYIEILGEPSNAFADSAIYAQVAHFRMQYPLLLITQDRALAEEILKLNDDASPVHVRKLDKDGLLSDIHPRNNLSF